MANLCTLSYWKVGEKATHSKDKQWSYTSFKQTNKTDNEVQLNFYYWGGLCHKQNRCLGHESRITSHRILWDVITYPCPRYLHFLAQNSSIVFRNTHKSHSTACPWWWTMECLLCSLICMYNLLSSCYAQYSVITDHVITRFNCTVHVWLVKRFIN